MAGISNHYDTMVQIQGIIAAIGITALGTPIIQPVINYKALGGENVADGAPCVLLAPWGAETVGDSMQAVDDVGYKTGIAIVAGDEDVQSLEVFLGWRQSIRRRMNNRSITTSGNYRLTVQPGPAVEPVAWQKDHKLVSLMVVTAQFQEGRT